MEALLAIEALLVTLLTKLAMLLTAMEALLAIAALLVTLLTSTPSSWPVEPASWADGCASGSAGAPTPLGCAVCALPSRGACCASGSMGKILDSTAFRGAAV